MISRRDSGPSPVELLDQALVDLEAECAKKRPRPTRYDARALLVPLGLLVLEGSTDGLEATLERVQKATESCDERWKSAVSEELQLACAEYVTSVDETYLSMPNYDFDYTNGARERLEARLRACEVLRLAIPDDMRSRIADADRIYEPYLKANDES